MNTDQLLEIIGEEISTVIIAGRYGDASLHTGGYVTCDPCYIGGDWRSEFSAAARTQQPEAYNGAVREWVEFQFRGATCYFKTCNDGVGPLGHCVDAGWVAAVPWVVVPDRVQKLFNRELIGT